MTTNKKILSRVLSLVMSLIIVLSFTACNNSDNTSNTSSTDTSSTTTAPEANEIPHLKVENMSIHDYRNEVRLRLEKESFYSEEEVMEFESRGYEVRDNYLLKGEQVFYCALMYRDEETLNLWYANEYGTLEIDTLEGYHSGNVSYLNVHHEPFPSEEFIYKNAKCSYVYNSITGKISKYEFGREIANFFVPEGSVYCGLSAFHGFIFRSGTDVYAVPTGDMVIKNSEAICIAHGVEFVIDVDYDLGSDPWSQPLFLMEDGSVKAYIHWNSDKHSVDSAECLVEVVADGFEGGYYKGQ